LDAIAGALEATISELFEFPRQETREDLRNYLVRIAMDSDTQRLRTAVRAVRNALA